MDVQELTQYIRDYASAYGLSGKQSLGSFVQRLQIDIRNHTQDELEEHPELEAMLSLINSRTAQWDVSWSCWIEPFCQLLDRGAPYAHTLVGYCPYCGPVYWESPGSDIADHSLDCPYEGPLLDKYPGQPQLLDVPQVMAELVQQAAITLMVPPSVLELEMELPSSPEVCPYLSEDSQGRLSCGSPGHCGEVSCPYTRGADL